MNSWGNERGSGDGGVCDVAKGEAGIGEVGVVEVGDVGGVVVDEDEDEGADSFCESASLRHLFFQ